ncbi:YlxQ-related RNA-binding protein [Vagococcus intermedius]|uniref:YlxQ-related RNA-binding protein n=1 Tax=Vagococcus intermedius TaxID=2991418 RepID=A0AAF0CTT4_9ENTE|nr:YlxQ-related RNA-binding protein [Vagococcus intermedius]WEG72756.1 YlxQ-related RNA-binding protein [Vagococcus intermedius]WEG74842.1 YlxQ-related RNA-binding protein [Vagococcus intermedius]
MTNSQKVLNLLGMATRAGKLVSGEELTIADIRSQKAKIVFVATDASPNTIKKIQDKSAYYNVKCVNEFTQLELSQAVGRSRMILGVCDQGFAKKFQELLTK